MATPDVAEKKVKLERELQLLRESQMRLMADYFCFVTAQIKSVDMVSRSTPDPVFWAAH